MSIKIPRFQLIYNGKNITNDLTPYLLNVTYNDAEEGESDEVTFTVEDTDGRWLNEWYPSKGDTVDLAIGYGENLMNCGRFVVDEIQIQMPPTTITIKALAAATNSPLRTKNSKGYEDQTLRKICEKVAEAHGYTVEGEISDVTIKRISQNRETDLAFLKRLAGDYGYLFSVRDKKLIFTSMYDLEKGAAVVEIDRLDILDLSYTDKSVTTYQKAEASYHNPANKQVVRTIYTNDIERAQDEGSLPPDVLQIRVKAENPQQSEELSKAALHKANTAEAEGTLTVPGNPLLVAGNNFLLTGLGKLSGKLHITNSTHSISRGDGYKTSIKFKRLERPTSKQAAGKAATAPKKEGKFIYTSKT